MGSYLTSKTISPKVINEDYIEAFENPNLKLKGFVLGDGIGSHFMPHEGSKFCVTRLKHYLETTATISESAINLFFNHVSKDLKEHFKDTNIDSETEKDKCFGTTLLCVIEDPDKFTAAYVGNGSIWHIRGNFSKFSPNRYLPWSAINMLNPHTIEENGKEALYKFFALEASDNQVKPTIVELRKDNDLYGDILLASTDGLYSADHNLIAKDKEGNLWISGDRKMELLINSLKTCFETEKATDDLIEKYVDTYLDSINTSNLIDDDLTFGMIITSKVFQ